MLLLICDRLNFVRNKNTKQIGVKQMKMDLADFEAKLLQEEKSTVTVEKYLRDVSALLPVTEN